MKLIIIHQNIESEILLINSFNSECIICKMSDYIFLEESLNNNIDYKDIILQLLNNIDDLSCLTHLTFVYKFYGDYNIPFFYTSNNSEYPFFNNCVALVFLSVKALAPSSVVPGAFNLLISYCFFISFNFLSEGCL